MVLFPQVIYPCHHKRVRTKQLIPFVWVIQEFGLPLEMIHHHRLKFVFHQVKTFQNQNFILVKTKLCFSLGTPKTLTGFQIRGEVTEINIIYDTLSTQNIEYSENVCSVLFLLLF
jgi:hypothetical protein